jgi:deoxyribonuclease-4
LINLASPDDVLWHKSIDALVIEWQRCEQLELQGLVVHPGAHLTLSCDEGLERVARAVTLAIETVKPQYCRLLLENTAGQGSCLGWHIQHLGWLLSEIDHPRVGICWDTCHALAAGYDFRTAAGMKAMLGELDQHGVLPQIDAIHANDSKKECGSRVDRHEHIGHGFIGEDGFRRFLKASPFRSIPMYLETPKGTSDESGEDWDSINLATLRRLASRSRRS